MGANRKIFAVDFDNLVNGSQLITTDMKALCYRLKYSIARRDVTYKSIEEAYLTESIYTLI